LEVTVAGVGYRVIVPAGVSPGQSFPVQFPAPQPRQTVEATAAAPAVYPARAATEQDYNQAAAEVPVATVVPDSQQHAQHFFAQPPAAKPVPAAQPAAAAAAAMSVANPFGDEDVSDANPFADADAPDAPLAWAVAPFQAEFDAAFQAACPAPRPGGLPPALTPAQVKALLLPTGLAKESLRAVWELSDIDKDGSLDADEFAVAMYLCRLAQRGQPVPKVLPENVVPPAKRNPF